MKLRVFSFFHLNLAYSAIEVERRPEVIRRSYWPLLELIRRHRAPVGIEASAWTLEAISEIDPTWIETLRELLAENVCEFIGCGYAQIIGPLVPAAVNEANLRLGMARYEVLLGCRPKLALVNEQAYSGGLVPLYRDAGYKALIMEWNNPARAHPDWEEEWRYLPQYVTSPGGTTMPVIWNHSIAFQKFQRYVHGEVELDEYLAYVRSHVGDSARVFPVYGNDAEVFDFRPGRYMTEAPVHERGEWQRIDDLFAALKRATEYDFVPPGEIVGLLERPHAGNVLCLESAAHPVAVKKQDKYNLLRWAVTGRDDLSINSRCWRLSDALASSRSVKDADWYELCYLWSSDFRTHITDSRWRAYLQRLERFEKKWLPMIRTKTVHAHSGIEAKGDSSISVERTGRYLEVKGKRLSVRLNCLKGLALDALLDRSVCDRPLLGTLPHGYFDDIQWGADFYSGHLVFETPGKPKITDLGAVEPAVVYEGGVVCVSASVATSLGSIEKHWRIDDASGTVDLTFRLNWDEVPLGSLRLGYATLMPEQFDAGTLAYRTHNGGREVQTFALGAEDFDHGKPVSFLISASQAVGMTEGEVDLGDRNHRIRVTANKADAAVVGMVSYHRVRGKVFCRLCFSARELDDTSRPHARAPLAVSLQFTCVPDGIAAQG